MLKYSIGVTYCGEWKDNDACGEGAVIDSKGDTMGEGIFSNDYMKHRSKNSSFIIATRWTSKMRWCLL